MVLGSHVCILECYVGVLGSYDLMVLIDYIVLLKYFIQKGINISYVWVV